MSQLFGLIPGMKKSLCEEKGLMSRLSDGRARTIKSQVTRISDNMYVRQELILDQAPKKRDYAPDLNELLRRGMSLDEASERLGMSKSYAYKLRNRY